MKTPNPIQISLRSRSRVLHVEFDDGTAYELPFEYLRTHSPSAEVQGHGPSQRVLVTGKQDVTVLRVEPVGQYAVKLVFDDGHDSGLFTWAWLHELGRDKAQRLADYAARVQAAQKERPGK